MEYRSILTLIAMAVGLVLIGDGITGFTTVSQSCCFGPDCLVENLCEAARPQLETPASDAQGTGNVALGVVLFLGGSFYLLNLNKSRR